MSRYLAIIFLCFCISIPLQAQWSQYGTAINGQGNNDQLGYEVSLNSAGDRLAVGLPFYANNDAGQVQVYEYVNGTWTLLGQSINGTTGGERAGWSLSLNAAGDRVAVAAPFYGGRRGKVSVYAYNGTRWNLLGSPITGEAGNDLSGWSASINAAGDRVVIGARLNDGNGGNSGHARIYEYNSGSSTWNQLGQDIDGEFANDRAGVTVTINDVGDRVGIGSKRNGGGRGHVRIFEYSGTSWTQLGQDINGQSNGDQASSGLDFNGAGDMIIVGSRLNSHGGIRSGHARVFQYNSTTLSWSRVGGNLNGESADDDFGLGVAINQVGNRVVVGGRQNDGNGANSGHARLYELSGGSWVQQGGDYDGLVANDNFGHGVTMNDVGDIFAVGAKLGSVNIYKGGQAIVYSENASCPDADGDGYLDITCGGTDCNDSDSTIHPGATEICDNIDNNCNSLIDGNDSSLVDLIGPTAICQNISIPLDASGSVTIQAADLDNGSMDDCGSVFLSLANDNFECTDIGQNQVTLVVTDGIGNLDSCAAFVTISDTTSPTALCHNLSVYLDGSGNATITPGDIDAGSSDACGIANYQLDTSSFTCTNIGLDTVRLTVTDPYSNIASCQALVNVSDTTSPTALCQNLSVYLDASGNATISPGDIDAGSSDACGVASYQLDTNSFTCGDIGTDMVTLTVTDPSSNTASCQAMVFIADTTSPTAICQDITVYLDNSGTTTITNGDVDGGTFDPCGFANLQIDKSSFDCAETGTNTVTLSVVDSLGNTASCQAMVFVADTTSPTALCQNLTVYPDTMGSATITTSDIDHGSTDPCGIAALQLNINNFDCQHVGTHTVTLTVTDNSANTSTCQALVWVADTIKPLARCASFSLPLDGTGLGNISPSSVNNGSQDACGVFSLSLSRNSFDCNDLGGNVVSLTVTDNNANSSSCSAVVMVSDTTSPTAVCQDITVSLDVNTGQVFLLPADVDNMSSDACGITSLTINPSSFDCSTTGNQSVVLTATDVATNRSSCTAQVYVDDSQSKPLALAPQNCNSCSQLRIFYCQFETSPANLNDFIDGYVSQNSQYISGNGLLWYEDANGSLGPLYNGAGQEPPTPDMSLATATYYYWVAQVAQTTGCVSDPIQVRIRVRKTPIPVFTPPTQPFCEGGTIDLLAGMSDLNSVADSFYLYNQNPAFLNAGLIAKFTATNGVIDAGQYFLVTPSAGTYTYWVVAVRKGNANKSSCEGVDSLSFVVSPRPVLTPVSSMDICPGEGVQLPLSSSPVSNILWLNNNQNIGLGANGNNNIQFTAAANNTGLPITSNITVYAILNGCLSSPTTFSISLQPSALLNTSSQTVCSDQATGLQLNTIVGSPVATSYELVSVSLAPGITPGAGNATPSSGLPANGLAGDIFSNYTSRPLQLTYTLRLLNTFNCVSDLQSITLTIHPSPLVSIGLTDTVCSGQAANLLLSLSNLQGNALYQWSPRSLPQGISTTTRTSPGSVFQDVLLNSTGSPVDIVYDVRATLGGCLGPVGSMLIHVLPVPVPVGSDSLIVCEEDSFPNQAIFDLTSISYGQAGSPLLAYFSDIHLTQPISNPTAFLSADDTVFAFLNTYSGFCSDRLAIYLRVNELISPQIDSALIFCENTPQLLSPLPMAGIYFNFYDAPPDSGGVLLGSGVSYNPMLNLGDSIKVWITTADSLCESKAVQTTVQIRPAPTAMAIAILPLGTICEGDTLQLIGAGGPGYDWQGPNGFSAQVQNPILTNITKASEGQYILTVTNTFNCSDSDTALVLVDTLPNAGQNDTLSILVNALPINLIDSLNGMPAAGGVWAGPFAPYNGDRGTFNPAWMSSGIYTYTQTSQGGCSYSNSIAQVWVNLTPTPCLMLNLKLFLEGPIDTATLLMEDGHRVNGYLPQTEPYTTAGYHHINGGGNENVASSVFATSGHQAIVDWLYVELRDASDSTVIMGSRSVLLQRDGDVVELDGQSQVCFYRLPPGPYYVVAGHRNHLAAMTRYPVYLDTVSTSLVDFTSGMPALFGINPQKNFASSQRSGGIKVMVSGDADGNGQVQNFDDVNFWQPQVGGAGYYEADYDLDSQVQNFDRIFFWVPNVGRGTQVPLRSN